jgi:hypothetical protein
MKARRTKVPATVKTHQSSPGTQQLQRDVKNEGRTDYVYEKIGDG